MVEVMVSVIIFSVGLIGVARLQVVAKQSNYDAVQRVAATSIAQDMLSRMRANYSELASYVSANGSRTIGRGSLGANEPSPKCDSSGASCSSTELVTHDLWEIEQLLDGNTEQDADGNNVGGLNLPTMCITSNAGGDSGVYTIAIAWRGKADLTNPTLNTCGSSTNLYGDSNEYRRLLVMSAYITNL